MSQDDKHGLALEALEYALKVAVGEDWNIGEASIKDGDTRAHVGLIAVRKMRAAIAALSAPSAASPIKAVTVTAPDGSPVAAPCAISGCQYTAASSARSQEPVAWRWHWIGGDEPDVWGYLEHKPDSKGKVVEPLYADASANGARELAVAILPDLKNIEARVKDKYVLPWIESALDKVRAALGRSEGRDA